MVRPDHCTSICASLRVGTSQLWLYIKIGLGDTYTRHIRASNDPGGRATVSCNKVLSVISWLRGILCISSTLFGHAFTLLASSAEDDTSKQIFNHRGVALAPRYDVVSAEDYWRDILNTGRVYTYPGVFWTSYPHDGPITQQGFWTARTWARQKFGRTGFVM